MKNIIIENAEVNQWGDIYANVHFEDTRVGVTVTKQENEKASVNWYGTNSKDMDEVKDYIRLMQAAVEFAEGLEA